MLHNWGWNLKGFVVNATVMHKYKSAAAHLVSFFLKKKKQVWKMLLKWANWSCCLKWVLGIFRILLTEKKGHKETVINPPALGFLSKVFVEVWIKLLNLFFVINLCSKTLLEVKVFWSLVRVFSLCRGPKKEGKWKTELICFSSYKYERSAAQHLSTSFACNSVILTCCFDPFM